MWQQRWKRVRRLCSDPAARPASPKGQQFGTTTAHWRELTRECGEAHLCSVSARARSILCALLEFAIGAALLGAVSLLPPGSSAEPALAGLTCVVAACGGAAAAANNDQRMVRLSFAAHSVATAVAASCAMRLCSPPPQRVTCAASPTGRDFDATEELALRGASTCMLGREDGPALVLASCGAVAALGSLWGDTGQLRCARRRLALGRRRLLHVAALQLTRIAAREAAGGAAAEPENRSLELHELLPPGVRPEVCAAFTQMSGWLPWASSSLFTSRAPFGALPDWGAAPRDPAAPAPPPHRLHRVAPPGAEAPPRAPPAAAAADPPQQRPRPPLPLPAPAPRRPQQTALSPVPCPTPTPRHLESPPLGVSCTGEPPSAPARPLLRVDTASSRPPPLEAASSQRGSGLALSDLLGESPRSSPPAGPHPAAMLHLPTPGAPACARRSPSSAARSSRPATSTAAHAAPRFPVPPGSRGSSTLWPSVRSPSTQDGDTDTSGVLRWLEAENSALRALLDGCSMTSSQSPVEAGAEDPTADQEACRGLLLRAPQALHCAGPYRRLDWLVQGRPVWRGSHPRHPHYLYSHQGEWVFTANVHDLSTGGGKIRSRGARPGQGPHETDHWQTLDQRGRWRDDPAVSVLSIHGNARRRPRRSGKAVPSAAAEVPAVEEDPVVLGTWPAALSTPPHPASAAQWPVWAPPSNTRAAALPGVPLPSAHDLSTPPLGPLPVALPLHGAAIPRPPAANRSPAAQTAPAVATAAAATSRTADEPDTGGAHAVRKLGRKQRWRSAQARRKEADTAGTPTT
eukprot:TRINITY_DN29575_c0_g1_i1.p1 TRINITY_DN29575_c0_g1~~TRINITY_DN29575_c0_g1_i1.p1  ORF type:complete len:822 (+),score=119.78 TRINITY_DN29575_c0_g1_i1:62-2467(+)